MKSSVHMGISSVASLGILALTHSWEMAVWSLAGGVLIDLDHLYDYFRARRTTRSLNDFFKFYRVYSEKKLFLWFHAFEWVLALGLLAVCGVQVPLTMGLGIGIFQHLLADQWGNGVRWGGYSLLYRWQCRFEFERLFYPNPLNTVMQPSTCQDEAEPLT